MKYYQRIYVNANLQKQRKGHETDREEAASFVCLKPSVKSEGKSSLNFALIVAIKPSKFFTLSFVLKK